MEISSLLNDTVVLDPATVPPVRVLNVVLADLPESAAEEMEGELPYGVAPKNFGSAAGPAASQVFVED